jgi:hypothetical protein
MRVLDNLPRYRPLPGARFEGWVFRSPTDCLWTRSESAPRCSFRTGNARIPAGSGGGGGPSGAGRARPPGDGGASGRAARDGDHALRTGDSHQAIAQALGVPGPRVKWRLHDALKRSGGSLRRRKIMMDETRLRAFQAESAGAARGGRRKGGHRPPPAGDRPGGGAPRGAADRPPAESGLCRLRPGLCGGVGGRLPPVGPDGRGAACALWLIGAPMALILLIAPLMAYCLKRSGNMRSVKKTG